MYNILAVEDDKYQRKNLVKMIMSNNNLYNVLESDTINDAIRICNEINIDLFYIDINLNEESGLNLALEIRKNKKYKLTWIVFITSHVKYMLEAFKEVHCYDYILKPYSREKVKEITSLLINNSSTQQISPIDRKFAIFNIEDATVKIFLDEILFIEVFIRTCYIYTKDCKVPVKNMSLKKITNIINNKNFIQSHRSYIVNVSHIKEIKKNLINWEICFDKCEKTALVGDKFKKDIVNAFSVSNPHTYEKEIAISD